jgi:hypothetical protein
MSTWISVKDRLPVDGQTVMVYYNEPFQGKYVSVWTYEKSNRFWIDGTVTHWMPLPEPPEK